MASLCRGAGARNAVAARFAVVLIVACALGLAAVAGGTRPAAAATTTTLFEDGFEAVVPWGSAEPWSTTPWHVQQWDLPPSYPTLQSCPGGRGGHCLSALSAPWQPNPYRTEISPDSPTFANLLLDDVEYVVTVKTFVRRYSAPAPIWMTIAQFKGIPGLGPDGEVDWACMSGRNPVSLTLANGKVGVNVNNRPADRAPEGALAARDVWTRPLVRNRWVSWRIRLVPSQTGHGIVQVWKDGTLVASRFGRNKDTRDSCGHPDSPAVFFKIGTYREYESLATQEVLFDDIRIQQVS